ncbi:MAG: oxygen-independent coproporphyrinogen oxidase [Sediminibacterium sp.]|nr:oxygen-independent coproporphyrinogen oxidase [Sediminibacterium sp.]
MAGIYIHIPFCKKACHYCNFHFSTAKDKLPAMVKAIGKEAALNRSYLSENIGTIYFGGGTPSLLSKEEISTMVDGLRGLFEVDNDAEITLEANPDDINLESLSGWKDAGINRLSIGIQSFFEEDLQWMNRAHNAEQALNAVKLAQQEGFHNITIDLIYGTPSLTDEKWRQNIETALALRVPHLSCYALTVEPKTALAKMIATHQSDDVDADKQARHFSILTERLSVAGFEHYEISNFALPGFRSRHNSSYWQGRSYLGLGPSAHSFNGKSRQWNIANNSLYVTAIEKGEIPFEEELLTDTQRLNEYIMTSLRTVEGTSLSKISFDFGGSKASLLIEAAQKHIDRGHLNNVNDVLQLTSDGKFLADGIAADLFFV